jgi:chromosome segregation ATPase
MKEKTINEKIKEIEKEKQTAIKTIENNMHVFKTQYESKIDKLRNDYNKIENDLKVKDEQLLTMKFSEEKTSALNGQRIEFFEKEIVTQKERNENLKKDMNEYKTQIDELNNRIDELKNENNKKKILEYEIERLKKDKENIINNYNSEQNNVNNNVNNENVEMINILKSQLETNKIQMEETKKIYDDVINTLKMSILNQPKEDPNKELYYKQIIDSNKVNFNYNKYNFNLFILEFVSCFE